MTQSASALKTQLAELSPEDRAELARFLLDSLEHSDVQWKEAWIEELDRRRAELRSGQVKAVPGEEVFRKLREKYG